MYIYMYRERWIDIYMFISMHAHMRERTGLLTPPKQTRMTSGYTNDVYAGSPWHHHPGHGGGLCLFDAQANQGASHARK